MGCSLINILKIQKDKIRIIGSGIFALVYSVCYFIFIKLINLDFTAIARNSQSLSNNSSIQINSVSSQSLLTTGLINFFLVFSLIVIFLKIKEKAGKIAPKSKNVTTFNEFTVVDTFTVKKLNATKDITKTTIFFFINPPKQSLLINCRLRV